MFAVKLLSRVIAEMRYNYFVYFWYTPQIRVSDMFVLLSSGDVTSDMLKLFFEVR